MEKPLETGEGLPALPLLIGNYVHAGIQGHTLKQVFVLPRKALRDNDTVYVIANDKLAIRKVRILRREEGTALVRGDLHAGDMVIVSRLDTAVEGMDLRLYEKDDTTAVRKKSTKNNKEAKK